MVEKVSFEGTTYSELPGKFEAGTPNVAGAIALETAINWYQSFDQLELEAHIHQLVSEAYTRLNALEDIEILGKGSSSLPFVYL